MHPPEFMCKALERIHPQLRLGWIGKDHQPGEALNQGCFALIQLYHTRDAERTFFTPWGDTGPIFGSKYDLLSRTPIYLADIAPEDVFSGAFLAIVRKWMKPMKERYMESAVEKGKAYESANQEQAEAQADLMLWNAKQTDATSDRTITNSDVTEADKAVLRGETKQDLTQAFTSTGNGMPLA